MSREDQEEILTELEAFFQACNSGNLVYCSSDFIAFHA